MPSRLAGLIGIEPMELHPVPACISGISQNCRRAYQAHFQQHEVLLSLAGGLVTIGAV